MMLGSFVLATFSRNILLPFSRRKLPCPEDGVSGFPRNVGNHQ
jgi:hypothetical protein